MGLLGLGVCTLVVFAAAGCGSFRMGRGGESAMLVAMSDEDAGTRREALVRVAESRDHAADWAVSGYTAIALLDDDPQTRCVAIRALAATCDPTAAQTFLVILTHESHPLTKVRPPTAPVRWEAAEALADCVNAGDVPEELRTHTREALIAILDGDPDKGVRLAGADGLGAYAGDVVVVDALIRGLADADFAVAHACENSLVRLTGVTQHCDARAWRKWRSEHGDDLFAHVGETPESRR
ncbi:MAG: hypothetical protein JXO22_01910, partial [Phycisphaerae bacterium]|nr:hypothetical protein [Phycisphaerae bacterium]